MTEGIVMFLFSFGILNRQLKLTLDLTHKEVVNNDVVGGFIKFVPDLYNFEFVLH